MQMKGLGFSSVLAKPHFNDEEYIMASWSENLIFREKLGAHTVSTQKNIFKVADSS